LTTRMRIWINPDAEVRYRRYNAGESMATDVAARAELQAELIARRGKLESALASMGRPAPLVQLLDEVDAALERIEHGTYGVCEICHEAIEADRLAADPLLRACIAHLNAEQRAALEADLALASQIQQGLLPANHWARGGWEISYHYQPAGLVGGDYCDLLQQDDEVVFLLGDASGKGVASSLVASHLHAVFRSLCGMPLPLQQMMQRANRVVCESTLTAHYATVVCGRAKPDGAIELASAGHCPALWIHGGEARRLEATGLPLGLFCAAEFSTRRLRLERGDSLLLYSDGLIEARNPAGEDYGMERLGAVAVAAGRKAGSREMARAMVEDWNRFRASEPPGDDLTVMALRRAG